MRSKAKKITLSALFSALMVVSGFLRIPLPPTSITLQLQVALLSGLLLGGEWGCISVLTYAALGLVGLPVFAGGGGFSYLLQPTFGYILGFAVAAFVTGKLSSIGAKSVKEIVISLAVGLAIVYGIGLVYAAIILTAYLGQTIALGEFLLAYAIWTLPKDLLLTAACVPLVKRLRAAQKASE